MAHIWSLSLEEQFYAGWPLILCSLGMSRTLRVAGGCVAAVILFRAVAIHFQMFEYWSPAFYIRPWSRFDSIMIGCCLALFLYYTQPHAHRVRAFTKFLVPAIVFPALLIERSTARTALRYARTISPFRCCSRPHSCFSWSRFRKTHCASSRHRPTPIPRQDFLLRLLVATGVSDHEQA
jgi:hypothetical protein